MVNKHLNNIDFIKNKELLNYLSTWQPHSIKTARTLPSFMYTSEEVYRLEQERLFNRCWLFVGYTNQLENPKSYFTVSIANIPLLIVKDSQGNLNAFHNICRHRAAPVALGNGNCNRLVCPYHGWVYDLEGNLKSVRDFEEHEDFDMSKYGLSSFPIDTWGPFIFVNLDPDCLPLKTQLNEIPRLLDDYKFSEWSHVHTQDYYINANWKLYLDNVNEIYHLPVLHQSSYQTNDTSWNNNYKQTRFTARHHYYLEYSPFLPETKEVIEGFEPGIVMEGLPPRLRQGYSTIVFWPNFAILGTPNIIIVHQVDPLSVSQTRIRWIWLVPNTIQAKSPENVQQLIELYDKIQLEDLSLLPEIQKRLDLLSPFSGPLSPTIEVGVHRFQELLMEYLTDVIETHKFEDRNFDEEKFF